MKAFANYFWKTLTVTFVGIGLTVAFSASASADETMTDAAFEDQIDPALLEYLLMSDNFQDSEALTPEEENLREEAERAALDKALEGFEARKALIEEEFWHLEFDGGIRSWDKGVIYFTTTEAGFEHYSAKFKSMIDDGYLVIDATFDMRWLTAAESEAAYWAAKNEESATVEQDGETSNSEPMSPMIVDDEEVAYVAIEPAEIPEGGDSGVAWFAYGPSGTEKGIDWSRLYYQFALLSMLTLQQPGSSVGVVTALSDSGQ